MFPEKPRVDGIGETGAVEIEPMASATNPEIPAIFALTPMD